MHPIDIVGSVSDRSQVMNSMGPELRAHVADISFNERYSSSQWISFKRSGAPWGYFKLLSCNIYFYSVM